MKGMRFDTFLVDSICASVSVTGVMPAKSIKMLICDYKDRPMNAVIGATLLRC